MIVSRIISGVSIDVDTAEGDGLYFEEEQIVGLHSYDVDSIKEFLYSQDNAHRPYSVMWELTNKCNFQCPFCYINCSGTKSVDFLPLNQAFSIIDSLVDNGMLFCTLTGGECTLHPEFLEIYTYLKIKGVLVTVFTNGSLLDEKHFELFSKLPPYKVEISIYGLSDDCFTRVTCNSYQTNSRILSNILRLSDMGIRVVCKTPLTKLTETETPEIRAWCHKNGIPFYNSPELLDSYDGESMEKYSVAEPIIEHYREVEYLNLSKLTKGKFGYKCALTCVGGKTNAFISYDMKLHPCSAAYGIEALSVPIFPDGANAAFIALQSLISKIKGRRLLFCQGCNYNDVCTRCIIDEYRPGASCQAFITEINQKQRIV